jgi:hypothetical protein
MTASTFATSIHMQTMCNIVLSVCTRIVNLYMCMNLQQFIQSAFEYLNLFINKEDSCQIKLLGALVIIMLVLHILWTEWLREWNPFFELFLAVLIHPPYTTTSFFVSCLMSDLTENIVVFKSELDLTIPVTAKAIPSI